MMSEARGNNGFWQRWQAAATETMSHFELACMGGGMSSSLSQVFMSGYQVAMRQVFDLPSKQWAAFCVSEGADGHPAVEFVDDGVIAGVKTWVAAADLTQVFVVKVGRGVGAKLIPLDREAKGLRIKLKPAKDFLPDLSIGELHLDRVSPGEALGIERSALKRFPLAEAGGIFVAFLAMLEAHGMEQASAVLDRFGPEVFEPSDPVSLRAMIEETRQMVMIDSLISPLVANWSNDRRLLDMYQSLLERS
jgi:hypothetical protein